MCTSPCYLAALGVKHVCWVHGHVNCNPTDRPIPSPLSDTLLEGEACEGFTPTLALGEGETAATSLPAPDLDLVLASGGLKSGLLPKPTEPRMLTYLCSAVHLLPPLHSRLPGAHWHCSPLLLLERTPC